MNTDVRGPSQVEALRRLDIVVANEGVGAHGSFLELDPEQVEAMIDVNLKGVLYTARAALPQLIERTRATSCRSRRSRASTRSRAAAFRRTSRSAEGRTEDMPSCRALMSPDDVAEVVLFALTRPRSMRLMTTTFRPVSEGSWG